MILQNYVTFLGILSLHFAVTVNLFILGASEKEPSASVDGFWCPEWCACSSVARIVDCSSLGLDAIPEVSSVTTRLYLHNNNISLLSPYNFKSLRHLTYLILSRNRIQTIHPEAFSRLHSLKYLILDGNNISVLPEGVLHGLRHLETVSLANNRLEILPATLFHHARQLTMINLQGNALHTISSLQALEELHTLNLQKNQLNGSVFSELRHCKKLAILRLNDNQIAVLPLGGINIPSLKALYLHSNAITTLPEPLFTNCTSLETLYLSKNSIQDLPPAVFSSCTSLTKLYLDGNNLISLPSGVFHSMQSAEGIFVCNNRLSYLPPNVFSGLPSIVTVHVEWNHLTTIGNGSFVNMPRLETVYLHGNNISHIEVGAFVRLPSLRYLMLHDNKIDFLHPAVLSSLKALQKIQLDPLPCSCDLLPLASCVKRHHIRGLMCFTADKQVVGIGSLDDTLCNQNTGEALEHIKMFHPPDSTNDSSTFESVKVTNHSMESTTTKRTEDTKPVEQVPVHITILNDIQRQIEDLKLKVFKLEETSNSCQRWVCLLEGVRLEPGDQWRKNGQTCSCLHDGEIQCS